MAVPVGMLDCKYWLKDGLDADIAAVKPLANRAVRSAIRGVSQGWTVELDRMPDDSLPHTKDFGKVSYLSAYSHHLFIQLTPR